jgi:hypothetical protein
VRLTIQGPERTLRLLCAATSSCSGSAGVDSSNTTSTVKARKRGGQVIALGEGEGYNALEKRFAFDTRSLQKDNKGNFVGAVRSPYEGRSNVSFGGGVGTASYQTNRYQSPTWKGNTRAASKVYAGNTNGSQFKVPSQFQGTSAGHLAKQSRFQGTVVPTTNYKAGDARESSAQPLDKPSDGWTDFRRRVFPQPTKMSKADYDRLTVEESRGILGRE